MCNRNCLLKCDTKPGIELCKSLYVLSIRNSPLPVLPNNIIYNPRDSERLFSDNSLFIAESS